MFESLQLHLCWDPETRGGTSVRVLLSGIECGTLWRPAFLSEICYFKNFMWFSVPLLFYEHKV